MRGSILDYEKRLAINNWIHAKAGKIEKQLPVSNFTQFSKLTSILVVILLDILWLILGTIWYLYYYPNESANGDASIIRTKGEGENENEKVKAIEAPYIFAVLSIYQFQRIYLGTDPNIIPNNY